MGQVKWHMLPHFPFKILHTIHFRWETWSRVTCSLKYQWIFWEATRMTKWIVKLHLHSNKLNMFIYCRTCWSLLYANVCCDSSRGDRIKIKNRNSIYLKMLRCLNNSAWHLVDIHLVSLLPFFPLTSLCFPWRWTIKACPRDALAMCNSLF